MATAVQNRKSLWFYTPFDHIQNKVRTYEESDLLMEKKTFSLKLRQAEKILYYQDLYNFFAKTDKFLNHSSGSNVLNKFYREESDRLILVLS